MDSMIPRGTYKVAPEPTEVLLGSSTLRKGSHRATVGVSEPVPSKIKGHTPTVAEAEEESKGGIDKPAPEANETLRWIGSDGNTQELDEFDQEVQVMSRAKGVKLDCSCASLAY